MKKENLTKIIYTVSGILFVISVCLFIVTFQNKESVEKLKKPKVIECEKELFKNGLMVDTSNYILTIKDNGELISIKEQEIYDYLTECKYTEMKNDNFLDGYVCVDTYNDDKKVTCSKDVLTDEKIWYVPYVDSLQADGYVCK